jgi:glucose/arabinose dehydrogenase
VSGHILGRSIAAAMLMLFLLVFPVCGDAGGDGAEPGEPAPAPEWPAVSASKVAEGLAQPTHIAHAGDGSGRLFLVEQAGRIRILRDGALLPSAFLDIGDRVLSGGERGLLSVAFPPGYADKRHFYVNYTRRPDGATVVARYRVSADPGAAEPASEEILLTIPQPFANHNGGQLAFGPDGFLYIGMGDGGSAGDPRNYGQNRGVLHGKLLRINVEGETAPYGIPPDNPFTQDPGVRDEIWALGLRNPWRFAFDRGTGDLYIADVGQEKREEVNVQPADSGGGENYGWNIMEGTLCFLEPDCDRTGLVMPVTEYDRVSPDCSVTGGMVYRGGDFPVLQGIYFYGDYCSGRIRGLRRVEGTWESAVLLDTPARISTFGEDEAGEIFFADHAGGDLYRIVSE